MNDWSGGTYVDHASSDASDWTDPVPHALNVSGAKSASTSNNLTRGRGGVERDAK
jgi:hypothetical protein